MAYTFWGILAKGVEISTELDLKREYTVRKISEPFDGSGVLIERYENQNPSRQEVVDVASTIGLTMDDEWVFLFYQCWGGCLDFVYTFLNKPSDQFGPAEAEDPDAEVLYVKVMEKFGVSREDALNFPPFRRGFWGER